MTRLRIVAAGHTPSLRRAVFGGDDDLDEGGRNAAAALTLTPSTWVCAPSRAAVQTAQALGATDFTTAPELADIDYGTWTGRRLDEVDLADWLTSPTATPHGGESLTSVTVRAGRWLDRQTTTTHAVATPTPATRPRGTPTPANLTAVAHPAVVRALLAYALTLPPDGIWRLDVAPLSVSHLTHRAGRWHLTIR